MLKRVKALLKSRQKVLTSHVSQSKTAPTQPVPNPTQSGPKILVACHPKSGSTYISESLRSHFNVLACLLHDSPEVQELSQSKVNPKNLAGFVGHNHILPTKNALKLIRAAGIQVVVLERALADCLMSMRDMYIERVTSQQGVWRGEFVSVFGVFGPDFLRLSNESQMDYLIACAAPWYLKFSAAWRSPTVDLPLAPVFIRYEDFFRSKEEGLAQLIQDLGVKALGTGRGLSEEDQESKRVRFNVGRVGRGAESLTETQMAQLWHMAQIHLANRDVSLPQVLGFEKP